jgi:hypothetical protein
MLREAYGDDVLSQMMTCEWFKHFKNGKTLMDGDKRSGRPSSS